MKRMLSALVFWAGLVLAATPVYAQFVCTDGTAANLSPFAATWSGYTIENGLQVPWVGTGTMNFEEGGGVSMTYATSVNGVVYTHQTTAGQFHINKDCTGTLTFTTGDGAGFTADLLVILDGFVILGTDTGPGDTMNFELFSILFGVQPNAAVTRRLLNKH